MLILWVIHQSLHIDKSHKNNKFLIIPTLSSNHTFVDIIVHFRSRWKQNSSEIPAHGIYRSRVNQIVQNKHNDEELELYHYNILVKLPHLP